ncbi:hypothetical protein AVEN_207048-1 [Araneus ventricosus]|uniref:Uncharacterized protein n=1 Tax=Araneus ventricosus TaxID=182803 RepID=A0A4Y2K0D0_ARAVE|nr:hypothetical protein AVEN_207048-1 [Araneus ventricosus]
MLGNAQLKRHLQLNKEINENEFRSEWEKAYLTFSKDLIIQSCSSHSFQQWFVFHKILPALAVVKLWNFSTICPCRVVNLCLTNHPPLRVDHLIQWINISSIPPLRNDHIVFTHPSDDIVELKLPN